MVTSFYFFKCAAVRVECRTWFNVVVGHAVSEEVADGAEHLLQEAHCLQEPQEGRALATKAPLVQQGLLKIHVRQRMGSQKVIGT